MPQLPAPGPPPPLHLSDFDYHLPESRIAQEPAQRRDLARLMVVERGTGRVSHRSVAELPELLRAGDLLVVNDTRVLPARLFAERESGGRIELLLLRDTGAGPWECMVRPGKRLRPGSRLRLPDGELAVLRERTAPGRWLLVFPAGTDARALMRVHGELPLPPYIRRDSGPGPADAERYQTVFAEREGAIAAPTAGLHLTEELLERIRAREIEVTSLTLHVGPGTFVPVRTPDPRHHEMEPEWVEIPEETAAHVNRARAEGRRVVAVGTTTTRALESFADAHGVQSGSGWASAFILPGFRFRILDALMTNFHLPRSTLLMLVSAFAGRELVLDAYTQAVEAGYRFYSYGDAMLVE